MELCEQLVAKTVREYMHEKSRRGEAQFGYDVPVGS
jgi:hypothetical protein